jgi:hypothetical protein
MEKQFDVAAHDLDNHHIWPMVIVLDSTEFSPKGNVPCESGLAAASIQ